MTDPSAHDPTTAWYSDPEFVAARNRTIPPGGATFYSKALPMLLSDRIKKLTAIQMRPRQLVESRGI